MRLPLSRLPWGFGGFCYQALKVSSFKDLFKTKLCIRYLLLWNRSPESWGFEEQTFTVSQFLGVGDSGVSVFAEWFHLRVWKLQSDGRCHHQKTTEVGDMLPHPRGSRNGRFHKTSRVWLAWQRAPLG